MKTVAKYTVSWLGLVGIAILNGVLREKGYSRFMSDLMAHQLSTGIAIILFGVFVLLLTRLWRIGSSEQAFLIGAIWTFLTVVFEFVFGHYVMGQPWRRLFHDYNLLQGRLWILLLVWTAVAPYVFFKADINPWRGSSRQ
jgi:hypothetical protein